MKKILAAIAAVAMIATVTVAASTDANAQFRRWGPAVGLGILGGVIVGSIIAQRYGPQYVYARGGTDPVCIVSVSGDGPGPSGAATRLAIN